MAVPGLVRTGVSGGLEKMSTKKSSIFDLYYKNEISEMI